MESPNLDALEPDELETFASEIEKRLRPLSIARALFPDRPQDYVITTKQLAEYARMKAAAISLRREGRIQTAKVFERICDRIYEELPDYAQW